MKNQHRYSFVSLRRGLSLKPILIGLAILFGVAAVWFWLRGTPAPEYNIVLVTFDTTRADRIGCYGAEFASTPTIDTMAKEGTRYEMCIAPTPITQPSHTSLLTGLYPIRHGIRDNGDASLSKNAVTLAEILKDAGYKTGAVIGAFVLDSQFGLDQGFDLYDDDQSSGTKRKFAFAERRAEAVTNSALNWLKTVKDSKFFLWAHYFDPHADYAPPGVDPRQLQTSIDGLKKLYDLEISYTDSQLGRLLIQVRKIEKETGRPTLFVFTSDHGESLGNHNEPTHGMFVYNDTVHVPLVVFDSLNSNRDMVVSDPVSLVDVFPTIVDRLNLKLPYEIDGQRLPASTAVANEQKRAVYFETVMPFTSYGWSPLEGIVSGDRKLIVAPTAEYFDLKSDPGETRNLYDSDDTEIEDMVYLLEDIKDANLNHPDLTVDEMTLNAKEIRKLMSLGYLTGGNKAEQSAKDLADPKDQIHLHRQLLNVKGYIRKGKIERAFDELRAIIQEDPGNGRAYASLALMAMEYRDKLPADVAIPLLRRRLELQPDVNTAVGLGMLYEKVGNAGSALTAFNKALEIDPDDLAALNNSAWYIYKLDGDLEVARQQAVHGIELIDQNPDLRKGPPAGHARHTLACILLKMGRTEEAVENLQAATKLVPNFASAFYRLGVARQTLGENKMAVRFLKHAIKLADQTEKDWLQDAKSRLTEIGP